jgi:hypothetical protein
MPELPRDAPRRAPLAGLIVSPVDWFGKGGGSTGTANNTPQRGENYPAAIGSAGKQPAESATDLPPEPAVSVARHRRPGPPDVGPGLPIRSAGPREP